MKRTAKLVSFGGGGDTVEYGNGCHGSGYGTPENPHAADPDTHDIHDGCPVIDKRAAIETPEGYAWVFRGPMVDVDLPPASVDTCPELADSIMVRAMIADGPTNEFGELAVMQMAHATESKQPGPLDSVDIATYIEGWSEHGARIGHYENGQIVWDN